MAQMSCYSWLKARWQQAEDWRQRKVESFTAFLWRGEGVMWVLSFYWCTRMLAWVLAKDGCQQTFLCVLGRAHKPILARHKKPKGKQGIYKATVQPRAIHQRCHCMGEQQAPAKKRTTLKTTHTTDQHTAVGIMYIHGYINKDIHWETVSYWPAPHRALSLSTQRQLCIVLLHQQLQSCDDPLTKTDIRQDIIFSHHTYVHG